MSTGKCIDEAGKEVSSKLAQENTDILNVSSLEINLPKLELYPPRHASDTSTQYEQSRITDESRELPRIHGLTGIGSQRKEYGRDSNKLTLFEETKAEPDVRPRQRKSLRKSVSEPLQSEKYHMKDVRELHYLTLAGTGSPQKEHFRDSDTMTGFEKARAESFIGPRKRISPRKLVLEPLQSETSHVKGDNPELARCLGFTGAGVPSKEHGRHSRKLTSLEKPIESAARPHQQKLPGLQSIQRQVGGNLTGAERRSQPRSRLEIVEERNLVLNRMLREARTTIGKIKEHEFDLQRSLKTQEERLRLVFIERDNLIKQVSDLEREVNYYKNEKKFRNYTV